MSQQLKHVLDVGSLHFGYNYALWSWDERNSRGVCTYVKNSKINTN